MKKIIVSVILICLVGILFFFVFGKPGYTGETVKNEETMVATITTSTIETTTRIKTTTPTTTSTSTVTDQLKAIVQQETNSDCESLGCPSGSMFAGSKTSKKYHNCDCTWAKKISQQNLVCFKSIEEAQNNGYIPCKVCKPQQ